MDIVSLKKEILTLLHQANPDITLTDSSSDIFSDQTHIMPRDMVFVCMELKKKYSINYNIVIDEVETYSLENFTKAIYRQIR